MTHGVRRVRDGGFTLVELVISLVLSSIVAGITVAIMMTSLNLVDSTSDISRDATDAGLIAAFLYRDAQAAGGTDPTTLADVPGLGVSTDDWATCEQKGELVVRFSWIDRGGVGDVAEDPMHVTWALRDDGRLVRRACQGETGVDVPLGEHVARASAVCLPGPACDATAASVELTITGSAERSPSTFSLSATLRPDVPLGAMPGGLSAPLVLVSEAFDAGTDCPELEIALGRVVVLGDALIDDACGPKAFIGETELFETTGAASLTASVRDPIAGPLPPAPSCAATTDPVFGTSPSAGSTVVHTRPVVVSGDVTLAPGRYVLCQGLDVRAGASLTGAGVFLHVVGGDVAIASSTRIDLAASGSAANPNLLLSVSAGNVDIGGGVLPAVLNGVVHVPRGTATVQPGTSVAVGALVADRLVASGPGPLRVGMPIPTITVEPSTFAPAQVGAVYPSVAMIADQGAGPYAWRATGLPAGLTLTSGGLLTGSPTVAGSFRVSITVVDATGLATVTERTLVVNPPVTVSAPASLAAAQVGLAYPATAVTATGGTPPYSFGAVGLPPGLSMTGAGAISGTPTSAGTSTVTVTVTDSIYATAVRSYSLTVHPALTIASPTALTNGTVGVAWPTTTVGASGGLSPYTFSASGLPTGLAVSSAGAISGTPTAAGSYSVIVTATDAGGATASRTYSVTIAAATTSSRPFDVLRGFQLLAEGDGLLGTWEIEGAAAIGGRLTHRNFQNIARRETSSVVVHTGGQPLGLLVGGRVDLAASGSGSQLTVDNGWLAVGNADSQSLLAFGSELHLVPAGITDNWQTPRVRSVRDQTSLPVTAAIVPNAFDFSGAFATLRSTATRLAALSPSVCSPLGSPTVTESSGNHTATLQANRINVWNLTIADIQRMNNVDGPTLPSATTPLVINVTDGGAVTVPVRYWRLLSNDASAPSILWNFPNASSISITASFPGSLLAPNAAVAMVDLHVLGDVAARTLDFRPWSTKLARFTHSIPCLGSSSPSVSEPGALPSAQTDVPLSPTTFVAGGGTGPYRWSAAGLPAGVSLSNDGVLSGMPTAAGTFTMTVTVTDSLGVAASRAYSFTVNGPPSITGPSSLPAGQATQTYPPTALTTTGGTLPFTWSASGLPAGLTINSAGTISGTPTTPTTNGPVNVTVTLRDASGVTATRTYSMFVADASVPAGCPLAPEGWRGEYYANTTLTGAPSLCRDDRAVSFNWNGASPGGSIPATNFSARWTRRQWFAAGTWQFVTGSDDGIRVYVNGSLVVEDWNTQPFTARSASGQVTLAEGFHTVVVEYYQGPGVSRVELEWSLLDLSACGDATTKTWLGAYYSNRTLSGAPTLCRKDASIDFDWANGSPDPRLPSDGFSVRWTRAVDFTVTGTYRFTAGSDDGVRVYVDGVRVINFWSDRAYGTSTADVRIAAGRRTITYEFYENGGLARATLTWRRL
jgi:choice-of-anchor A domain-containing protein/prepilin-type N-terminal cleavage/methylation domain-containing protein